MGSGENVAEFGVHLLQQVQILQSEYPGRIQPEHMEEMKWDHCYEGLNPEYCQMLVHKVDGTWKLERRAESRDPPPPKTAVTSVLNWMHSQTPGNLFPLHKLKGNHTFNAQAVTIGNNEAEEDSSAKQEGEVEPSGDKQVEAPGGVGGTAQPMEYIVHYARAVKLYQQKKRSCFGCRSPGHLIWDCPKDINKPAGKVDLNTKEGMAKKGGWAPPRSQLLLSKHPLTKLPKHKDIIEDSLPESRPTHSLEWAQKQSPD